MPDEPESDDRTGVLGGLNPDSAPMARVDERSVADLVTGAAVLLVLRGQAEGTRIFLDPGVGVVSVGRSPESTIFLDDVTVSRRHADLRAEGGRWQLRDAGSLNGSYVNRQRVEEVYLDGGDEVQIGKYRFAFLVARGETPGGAGG